MCLSFIKRNQQYECVFGACLLCIWSLFAIIFELKVLARWQIVPQSWNKPRWYQCSPSPINPCRTQAPDSCSSAPSSRLVWTSFPFHTYSVGKSFYGYWQCIVTFQGISSHLLSTVLAHTLALSLFACSLYLYLYLYLALFPFPPLSSPFLAFWHALQLYFFSLSSRLLLRATELFKSLDADLSVLRDGKAFHGDSSFSSDRPSPSHRSPKSLVASPIAANDSFLEGLRDGKKFHGGTEFDNRRKSLSRSPPSSRRSFSPPQEEPVPSLPASSSRPSASRTSDAYGDLR